jgi:aminopeptidase N
MKKILFLLAFFATSGMVFAQTDEIENDNDTTWKTVFRGSEKKINALVHTRLEVRFDYAKAWMYGKAWLTLRPQSKPTDSLRLDAKGMDIKEVTLVTGNSRKKLRYNYDGMQLAINLDKTYTSRDKYTVYVDYVAKPNELKAKGSAAISDAKGLYFINPDGKDPDKPTQIWTQGETESNSAWMPTIDKPNQKTTQELSMTVPDKYVTLSNGLLISKKKNADGTRTDYWKMDLPHAPYLFFMGVGDFAIINDTYKGKVVDYYVEKKEAPYARAVFGNTPEMMRFFSDKLGVEYPWPKYSQMVGRDYVSGAMENTSATLHQESAYQNFRQLTEGNQWEETIAHELFHQWFGDLVTTESWSNLTVNESFANYSEYLWMEYKKGKDAADEHHYQDMMGYLQGGNEKKDLVRYYYRDKEEMFDGVSYNKGGRILNMLRNYVGDEAFYKSLNNYLTTNKFKTGEAAQLRLAFEEVTGEDLNWFWKQWYYGSGHPKLKISYLFNDTTGMARVVVEQTQKNSQVFNVPLAIDVYNGTTKTRYPVWLKSKSDTFSYSYSKRPDLINVDGDKVLLCEKTDNKSTEQFLHQYKHAPNYLDRREALEHFSKKASKDLLMGLQDRYAGLRTMTVNRLGASSKLSKDKEVIAAVEQLAGKEKDKRTLAAALGFLGKTKDAAYLPLYRKYVSDSSYSVSAAAFDGLQELEPENAYTLAKSLSSDTKGALSMSVSKSLIGKGSEADFDVIANGYKNFPPSQEKLATTESFCGYLEKINDPVKIKKGIDHILSFRNMIPEQYRSFIDGQFKPALDKLGKAKGKEITDYIEAGMR